MAFLGLVPGERSSGATVRPRGITKTGNKIVRSHLLEAAWCYRLHAKIGERLVRRDSSLPELAKEIAWKAQVRLCGRYRRLMARGKKSHLVTTAIARELVGFIWAIGREFHRSRLRQPKIKSAPEAAHQHHPTRSAARASER